MSGKTLLDTKHGLILGAVDGLSLLFLPHRDAYWVRFAYLVTLSTFLGNLKISIELFLLPDVLVARPYYLHSRLISHALQYHCKVFFVSYH